ncbi:SRPBCC family protein [Streptomyces sp. CBMA156]|uniref:SRPBCC family protein n=1 Tax=Streptomyces sp. CBMA156 TaxID=1930280 RepID=UPI00166193B1|nr:SRPBCC family protein [Streptomyces sp. CBMA156]MBD0672052.1 polyketide cyclase [Streptomyces sp. CBMA156]MBD0676406.1 polyketide cyclase [Streptomyces sp. CBMA156]
MRYADGPGTRCEVFVAAPVARVWQLVTDIGLPARLSPELRRVAWLDGADGPAVGAHFEGHNSRADMPDWRTVSEITEITEAAGRCVLAWGVMDADGRYGEPVRDLAGSPARWRFELAPEEGGTRLRQSVVIGPGRSGASLVIDAKPELEEKIVDFRLNELRTGMTATLEGIKSLAERAGWAVPGH